MEYSFPDGPPDWWLVFFMPGLEIIDFAWVPILGPDIGGQSSRTQSGKFKQDKPPLDAFMDYMSVFSGRKFVLGFP